MVTSLKDRKKLHVSYNKEYTHKQGVKKTRIFQGPNLSLLRWINLGYEGAFVSPSA